MTARFFFSVEQLDNFSPPSDKKTRGHRPRLQPLAPVVSRFQKSPPHHAGHSHGSTFRRKVPAFRPLRSAGSMRAA